MGINLYHGYIPIALHGARHWFGPVFQLANWMFVGEPVKYPRHLGPLTVSEKFCMGATSASLEELEHTHTRPGH